MTRAEAEFEALVRACGARVLAYLCRRLPSAEDAADAYQDTLTTAWRKVHTAPTDPTEALPWLLAVARRTAANHRRASTRRLAATDRLAVELAAGGGGGVAALGVDDTATARVTEVVATLGEDDREVVALTYWDGLTADQVAVVLGVRPATVRKRLERARRRVAVGLARSAPVGTRPG